MGKAVCQANWIIPRSVYRFMDDHQEKYHSCEHNNTQHWFLTLKEYCSFLWQIPWLFLDRFGPCWRPNSNP